MKEKGKKTPLIAIAILLVVGVIGGTIAYFTNKETFENIFGTAEYNTTINETFKSPKNWVPGTTTTKRVEVINKGNVPVVVRAKIDNSTKGWYTNPEDESTKLNLEDEVTINYNEDSNWEKVGDYFYYKTVLENKNDKTQDSFIESVTFNSTVKIDEEHQVCEYTYTYEDGTTSTGDAPQEGKDVTATSKNCKAAEGSYAGSTYRLDIVVETMQAENHKEVWTDSPINM